MIRPTSDSGATQAPRFAFGRNWADFVLEVDEVRVAAAVDSLRRLIVEDSLVGKRFLDIGCGSGLSSLAAVELGGEVHGFDYDMESVRASEWLRAERGYSPDKWVVEQGSVLDASFMESLGSFDIVYSWGVLHHTGSMWDALALAARAVCPGGKFALAIYNDQGGASARWHQVKRTYVSSPRWLQTLMVVAIGLFFETRSFLIRLIRRQNPLPFSDWRGRRAERGMSVWHDLRDWIGGYPFEVAKPEQIFDALHATGFRLEGLKTCAGGHGCNEFLFVREGGEDI